MRAGQTNNLNKTKSNYIKSNQTNPIQYKQLYFESDQIKSNQVILSSIQSKSSQTKQNKIVLGDTPSNRDYLFFWAHMFNCWSLNKLMITNSNGIRFKSKWNSNLFWIRLELICCSFDWFYLVCCAVLCCAHLSTTIVVFWRAIWFVKFVIIFRVY